MIQYYPHLDSPMDRTTPSAGLKLFGEQFQGGFDGRVEF